MIDAYCHLDMDAKSPIADIEWRMSEADVSGGLLVETWDGRNALLLRQADKFSVALCYRSERRRELLQLIERDEIVGVRMAPEHIRRDNDFCREISKSGKTAGGARGSRGRIALSGTHALGRNEDLRSPHGMAALRWQTGFAIGKPCC